ncbi:hypothetical protein ES711_00935 [Gelidibacter salicanalis]|uniref:Uncharacterized protein n=1 Tax=Gelidibacter salicanalis TaxID=291193 RepID=A0A5C7AVE1_9FLAO|nr:hypothetical protein [Gelidibacter salicanalis]TXE10505.1 hypothetical protein ES711_00935 [Gelidibacter salicanalis]
MEITPKGRPKNSKNKATAEIRERFRELVECNLSTLQDDLDSLQPIERLTIIIQMAKFVLPTLKTMDLNATGENIITSITRTIVDEPKKII